MRKKFRLAPVMLLVTLAVAGCTDVRMLGAAAAEQRRVMNDMQARATMAAVCDMSLGAYLRELNEVERLYAGLVCGDAEAMREAISSSGPPPEIPEQLEAEQLQSTPSWMLETQPQYIP